MHVTEAGNMSGCYDVLRAFDHEGIRMLQLVSHPGMKE